MTSTTDRSFPALNAVRAVGALAVVATHAAFDTGEIGVGAHGAVLSRLDFGVALFFVISGFLLSRPFFAAREAGTPRPGYRHYLWKRALRILPLYWLTVVMALLLVPGNAGAGPGTWRRNLTLTQVYAGGLLPFGLTQLWSLCTEVAFYLALPVLAVALVGRSGPRREWATHALAGLGPVTAAGVTWQTVVAVTSDTTRQHYHQWLPGFLPWFAVGIAFAVVSVHAPHRPAKSRWHLLDRWGSDLPGCWLIGGAVFALACTPLTGPRVLLPPDYWEAFLKTTMYGVSAAFLLLPLMFGPERDGFWRRTLSTRTAAWLGDVSYGIFCLHLIVLTTVLRVLHIRVFTGHFATVFVLTVLGTLILASVSLYLLERPCLRLKNSGPFAPTRAVASARSARP
ncbi:MAG: acyltransferase family protein [Nocardioidaceae bacterium]